MATSSKTSVKYKDLMKFAIRDYSNGKRKQINSKIPDYAAVLSHYLMAPERGPVFGGNDFKTACAQALYEFSESTGRKNIVNVSQLKLLFNDIPFPPPTNPKFTFIDLFAGIGGIRIAFQNAGGKCVFSSEWNTHAQQTYFENFGEYPFGDIKQFTDIEKIPDNFLYKLIPDHDVLCAGFPCQPFSIAGVSKKNSLGRKHGFEDPTQGTLFFDLKRILKVKRPKAFFLENVKHLVNHDGGQTFTVIRKALDELGYVYAFGIVDASKWLPQHRERIFIVGYNPDVVDIEKTGIIIPDRPDRSYKIPDLSSIIEKDVAPNHTLGPGTWSTLERHKKHHAESGNGFGYGLIPFPVPENTVTRTISARYYKDGAEVLIAQKGRRPRRLTVKEAKQLQGFEKDRFIFPVSDSQAYRQIGNSVTVPAVEATAKEITKVLQRNIQK
ncbi:MAG: DNA (cytosine-5-)-methyltransferase [Chitinispirillaceae bacterium]|jgi:DNA (cytosine-5)-methyltransferase 1